MALDALHVVLAHTVPVKTDTGRWSRVEGDRDCFVATGAVLGTQCKALYVASDTHREYLNVHLRLEFSAQTGDLPGLAQALADGAHPDGVFSKNRDGDVVDLLQRAIDHRGPRIDEVVTTLLDAGASARSVDLCRAWGIRRLRNMAMLQRLLEAGADANAGILSLLVYNHNGSVDPEASGAILAPCIDLLMQHGASLSFVPNDHCAAIHYLAGTVPVAMLLELLDTEPHALKALNDWDDNQGILHYLASFYPYDAHRDTWRVNAIETIRALVGRGCTVCDTDDEGRTPLHALCLRAFGRQDDIGRIRPMLECLLDLGADVNGADAKGCTPLHMAAMQECPDSMCVAALLDHGAHVNAKTLDGKTPLALAVESSVLRVKANEDHRRLRTCAASELMMRGGFP